MNIIMQRTLIVMCAIVVGLSIFKFYPRFLTWYMPDMSEHSANIASGLIGFAVFAAIVAVAPEVIRALRRRFASKS